MKAKDETGEWKWNNVQSSLHCISSILHVHDIENPSRSLIPLRASYHPVAQTKMEDWVRTPESEAVIKWCNPQRNKTIWRSRGPLRAGDLVFTSQALWIGLDNPSARFTLPPVRVGNCGYLRINLVGHARHSPLSSHILGVPPWRVHGPS